MTDTGGRRTKLKQLTRAGLQVPPRFMVGASSVGFAYTKPLQRATA